ncbi:MAG: glutamate-5-semialdehyde dehydrogenase [Alphaproteobacteria bacterium]
MTTPDTLPILMEKLGQRARAASTVLAQATTVQKNAALLEAANQLRQNVAEILKENEKDLNDAEGKVSTSVYDRLLLNAERIENMAVGIEAIAALSDPVGTIIREWSRPNGLKMKQVRVPLGVIGIIYESRPNVTIDAGALSLKSGNVAILRGGRESFYTSAALIKCLQKGLESANISADAIQMVPVLDREAVNIMLKMDDFIDVIVPRGGKSLIELVQRETKIPTFKHFNGICHVFVARTSEPEMARDIIVNSKMRRPSVCNAAETLLIARNALETHFPIIADALIEAGCALRGEEELCALDKRVTPATEEDWGMEYLAPILSVKIVADIDEAILHINQYSSQHSEVIVTEDANSAQKFFAEIDSAIIYHNAPTSFSDGGEFGFGAEIGIATGRLHARGPVGLEQLTTYKCIVEGQGQIRD